MYDKKENANTESSPFRVLKGAVKMKCAYCGRELAGEGTYCSERCRKRGEAATHLAARTRIPFWIVTALAGALLLLGIVFWAAGALDKAFWFIGGAAALEGLILVVLPRGKGGANTFCQIIGGVLFAVGVICIILWR